MISTVSTVTLADNGAIRCILNYSIIITVELIILLAITEILGCEAPKRINQFIKGSHIAAVPLLFVFTTIVIYKTMIIKL
jgi:hypothetical protein